MTIRELNQITDSGENIKISYAGKVEPLNRFDDAFQMIAYGDYLVDYISIVNGDLIANVKMIPAKD